MSVKNIVRSNDPILTEPCKTVTKFSKEVSDIVTDIIDTMKYHNYLYLTAPHIGIPARIFVMGGFITVPFINPIIVHSYSTKVIKIEFDPSFPNTLVEVYRNDSLQIRYTTLQNKIKEEVAYYDYAHLIQHCMDQLNGKRFIDVANYVFNFGDSV